jgi:hypothetical protein
MRTTLLASFIAALALMLLPISAANAVGPGKQCSGLPGIPCDAGLFCQKKPGTCAVIDASGICTRVPKICPKIVRPVCGCDNKTYNNDCERQQAMVSLAHNGKCTY